MSSDIANIKHKNSRTLLLTDCFVGIELLPSSRDSVRLFEDITERRELSDSLVVEGGSD